MHGSDLIYVEYCGCKVYKVQKYVDGSTGYYNGYGLMKTIKEELKLLIHLLL